MRKPPATHVADGATHCSCGQGFASENHRDRHIDAQTPMPEELPEEFKILTCPNCDQGHDYLTLTERLHKQTTVECRRCGEQGTIAYFTPAPEPPKERLIERLVHVENGKGDAGHVKAIAAAIALLAQAANEESLDLRWDTLRMSAAYDAPLDRTTHVVVIKARPRVHARGGVASGGSRITVSKDASKDVDLDAIEALIAPADQYTNNAGNVRSLMDLRRQVRS